MPSQPECLCGAEIHKAKLARWSRCRLQHWIRSAPWRVKSQLSVWRILVSLCHKATEYWLSMTDRVWIFWWPKIGRLWSQERIVFELGRHHPPVNLLARILKYKKLAGQSRWRVNYKRSQILYSNTPFIYFKIICDKRKKIIF